MLFFQQSRWTGCELTAQGCHSFNKTAWLKMPNSIRIISAALLVIQLWFPITGTASVPLHTALTQYQAAQGEEILAVLFCIFREVKEFGMYDGDNFIKREFHIDVDGRRQNSEEFVVVLIHDTDEGETMILELTYFADKKTIYSSKYVHEIKRIVCSLKQDSIQIVESTFSRKEMDEILPVILEGIISKKKLLEILKKKPSSLT